MARVFVVTGGAGFIGSHVTEALIAGGQSVRVIDNFSTGRRENLAMMADDVELIEGDIRSYERVHRAIRGAECVIHLAALPSVPRSVQDPLTTHEVNTTGTLNVLLAARDEGVRRVVFASSSSVYGAGAQLPKEESQMLAPISPYGVSKLTGERYCYSFHCVYGLETVALRYFNVFGPRQDPHSQYSGVVALFLRCALEGRDPIIYGDGHQTRDFTYVANVVQATLSATEAADASGQAVNVACGSPRSVLDLLGAVDRASGRDGSPLFFPAREGDILHSYADISAARRILGYEPVIALEDGIRLTLSAQVAAGAA